jgi:hypothetical protein
MLVWCGDLRVNPPITHTGWWLRWHTDRHACRELTELAPLQPQAASASAERPAA